MMAILGEDSKLLLLMEEILHHLGGTIQPEIGYLSTGAGFLPSTLRQKKTRGLFDHSSPT